MVSEGEPPVSDAHPPTTERATATAQIRRVDIVQKTITVPWYVPRYRGITRLAEIAYMVNERAENIGARRLHTVMEKLLEDISFDTDRHAKDEVVIDAAYVDSRLKELSLSEDLARYVL